MRVERMAARSVNGLEKVGIVCPKDAVRLGGASSVPTDA